MKIYYDFRMNEFVKEIDPILPPELFCIYEIGIDDDIIIEKYMLDNGKRMDYSYPTQMPREMINRERRFWFRQHLGESYINPILTHMIIPKENFIACCEEAGFDDYIEKLKRKEC